MQRAELEAFIVITLITALCVLMWIVLVVPEHCAQLTVEAGDWSRNAPAECFHEFPPYPPR
jgi:hypothetical protein